MEHLECGWGDSRTDVFMLLNVNGFEHEIATRGPSRHVGQCSFRTDSASQRTGRSLTQVSDAAVHELASQGGKGFPFSLSSSPSLGLPARRESPLVLLGLSHFPHDGSPPFLMRRNQKQTCGLRQANAFSEHWRQFCFCCYSYLFVSFPSTWGEGNWFSIHVH